MKNKGLLIVSTFLLMAMLFTSCEAIAGIFKAGMGVGAFAVIAVIVLIIFLITRVFKGKGT